MTVGEALAHGTHVLAEAGIDTARLEAELMLAKACDDCARALLYMELRRELSPEAEEAYEAVLARRARREPLAYILGITLNGGLVGIWTAAVVYVVLLSSAMVWKFSSGDWKTIKL